jgi:hypothetical protein
VATAFLALTHGARGPRAARRFAIQLDASASNVLEPFTVFDARRENKITLLLPSFQHHQQLYSPFLESEFGFL